MPNDFISKNLTSQLFRSGSSIGANFNEAYAASSKKDFINFFHHALKSANESKFWLELIKDIRKVDESKIGALTEELDSICRILAKSIITAKNRK
ncbi:MAG: hypothetical protein A3A97_02395 [Candidatus Terrybacteria bacterium RIFCSPLOWO2_01_FULL_40_23]|uniref:Four helix bundle protein n=1 Tax=Candidatus Terrybacteria bacterium RIFCSPLOWO2_01_FULL_40_23 TaxID=1802366 RepID=A0A1G2PSN2_9BACT|nr:MAG: hypothetical protein A3A97_02395 [Candidatus Terrybacteria bacterium RIFCSPLOWO2_01_FULL_40_23]